MQEYFDAGGGSVPPTPKLEHDAATDSGPETEGERTAFELSHFLESVHYPATKQDILDYADDQGADPIYFAMFEELPDTTYNSPTDVSQALGENANVV